MRRYYFTKKGLCFYIKKGKKRFDGGISHAQRRELLRRKKVLELHHKFIKGLFKAFLLGPHRPFFKKILSSEGAPIDKNI